MILLLLGITVNIRRDRLSLQGSTICRWCINATLPEVAHLQDMFLYHFHLSMLRTFVRFLSLGSIPYQNRWTGQPLAPQDITTVRVSQIYGLNPHDVVGNSYLVDIAIKSLAPNQPWWYLACASCKRTNGSEKSTLLRHADIDKDEPKIAEFIFFSELGEQLIVVPAQQLVQSAGGNNELIPAEITRVYGKRYSLRVSVTRRALQRIYISYQVDSMSILLPHCTSVSSSSTKQQETIQITTVSPTTPTAIQELDIPPATPIQSTPAAAQFSPLLNPALVQESLLAKEPLSDLPAATECADASTHRTSTKRKLFEEATEERS